PDASRRTYARGAVLHAARARADRGADLAARPGSGQRSGAGGDDAAIGGELAANAARMAGAGLALGAGACAAPRARASLVIDFRRCSADRIVGCGRIRQADWRRGAP